MPNNAGVFQEKPARTIAVLTTAEVAATTLQVGDAFGGTFGVEVDFTVGSLTDVSIRFYVSNDASTWRPFADLRGERSYALTENTSAAYQFQAAGWKFFKVSFQGAGTVTNSLAAAVYRMLRRGSQG